MGGDFDIDWKDYTFKVKYKYDTMDDPARNDRYIKIYAESAIQAWISALNHSDFDPVYLKNYHEHD